MAAPSMSAPCRADEEQRAGIRKLVRTRSGCLNCRKRKRKCDEKRPSCGDCIKRNFKCSWNVQLTFREENAHSLDASHPSMILAARHGPQLYEIRDVTAEVVDGCDGLSPPALDFGDGLDETSTGKAHAWAGPSVAGAHQSASSNGSASYPHSLVSAAGSTPTSASLTDFASPQRLDPPASPVTRRQTARAVADLIFFSQSGDLSAANNPIAGEGHPIASTGYLHHGQSCTPNDSSFEDGIFLPGSTYHELHATLRSHLIHGTRPDASTRPVSPIVDRKATEPFTIYRDGRGKCSIDAPSQPSLGPPNDQAMMSKQEECSLWRIWFEEISPWLDKFDNNRHFQHSIPTLASTHGHLHYSILALCARQQELKDKARPTGQSLALYQEAIHGLLPDLASRSTEVIASCVILCVLEMLSCSPMAWQRHLDGCASFLNAVRANGFVGGLDQALFWCFARMDVWAAFISSVPTLIPVSNWASGRGIDYDARLFSSGDDFADWANYAVYLLAQVLNLLAPRSDRTSLQVSNRADSVYRAQWLKLWDHVRDWFEHRPPQILPVASTSSSASLPFPTIIFSNPAAISGNQMHHTASILMLQNQPAGVKLQPIPRSILWHARRICAISISNHHHGAWTNAVQPLWLAGKCMSHPEEHKAIIDILERIERESGWGTRWRQEDLQSFWGDLRD